MDEKQAIRSIDKFINMRFYHYALMINGKWGCGKTHFVQNTLIPHIKATKYSGKEKDVNYVSLYGINNTESITEQLCSQAIKDYVQKRNDKIKMEGKAVGIASVILGTAIKWGLAKADISTDRMDKIIELLPDYDNNVIIFDDLERCCCDVNEVLGFINNFIEHSNAAVIIIANEEEIGNWSDETNTALQLMIALNERIDIPVVSLDLARQDFKPFSRPCYAGNGNGKQELKSQSGVVHAASQITVPVAESNVQLLLKRDSHILTPLIDTVRISGCLSLDLDVIIIIEDYRQIS